MREQFISLESQLRSHERTVQTLQPKYMDALRDRGTFEKQCQKAVQQFEAQKAEIESLKEKNRLLESKLAEATDALANSTNPEAARLAQAEKQRDESLASVDKLKKKIRSLQNEAEYSRKAYQDASNSHTELARENQELRTRVADLERRAGENLFRIHQLHAQTETKELGRLVDELRATLENRERELERARDEVRVLRNGRRETRQASVPRSPRTGVMSPRPNRGVGGAGGAGSRGTSPAPFMSSDGPGVGGGGAGGTLVPGMTFLPTAGGGGRWGHLREY
jgi:chromosome segregation ATPase